MVVGAHYDVCGDIEGADDNQEPVIIKMDISTLQKREEIAKQAQKNL